jgi:4-amino-4-deoxy-L-arabinose transferase-like glycosyltransferase
MVVEKTILDGGESVRIGRAAAWSDARKRGPIVVKIGVVLASFIWTYIVGHFGLYAFDQSMMFDGGWRILCGQVPFKDFVMAFGPLSFTVQALFFKLFGVNWTAMVLAGAFVAAVAAISVMRSVGLLFGKERIWLIGLAGLLVGTSFQSMFGTLWIEQVGFLACLIGIQMICESIAAKSRARFLHLVWAGALAVVAFLAKQNVGVLTCVLLGVLTVLVARPEPKDIAKCLSYFLIGILLAGGLFVVWLVIYSDPHLFIRHALQVPSQMGRDRISWKILFFPPWLLQPAGTTEWCYAVSLGAAFQVIVLLIFKPGFRESFFSSSRHRIAFGLAVCIPLVQRIFEMTTKNMSENVLFLSGLILSVGIGLFLLLPRNSEKARPWIPILAFFVSFFMFAEIAFFSWNRMVRPVFPQKAYNLSKKLHVPELANVFWITPTLTGVHPSDPELNPQDIDAVCSYLRSQKKDFLVLGDSSYLYGINGVVPPQPLLYFQTHHFYDESDIPRLDEWFLSSVKKRDIRLIVREKVSVFPATLDESLPLPNVNRWVSDNFHAGPTFGNFEILER